MEYSGLLGYLATGAVSLLTGYWLKRMEPASRLVFWNPHSFLFSLFPPAPQGQTQPAQPLMLQTNTLIVQNIGRRSAEKIEIIHQRRPDHFQFATATNYSEATTPTGEHVIQVESLGKGEILSLQLLAYVNPPVLAGVRSKDGHAKGIAINIQRVLPKAVRLSLLALTVVGAVVVAYGLARASMHAWEATV